MDLKPIGEKQKPQYNKLATHIMQSWQWGEFRQNSGAQIFRFGLYPKSKLSQVFQITFHKIPLTNLCVGYIPRGPFPDQGLAQALKKIGQEHHSAFIKAEPDILFPSTRQIDPNFHLSPKHYFSKYNYLVDLTKPEEELLKNMHSKFRYNIKVAQKHGVWVEERTDDEAFNVHLRLHFETVKRQRFHSHNQRYHQFVWETFQKAGLARVLIAFYKPTPESTPIPLTSWMLLNFKNTLYYPYGSSSSEYRNVMASNLVVWEAIKLGKRLGLKKFDLWGALGPNAKPSDPWWGFSRFKSQVGGDFIEYIGTYDLVLNWPVYFLFNLVEKATPIKLFLLKLTGKR